MRPLELTLSIMNLCALVVLVVPRLRASHWLRPAAPAAPAVACAQVLIEGGRWQMVPAYVLAAAFLLVWLAGLHRWSRGARPLGAARRHSFVPRRVAPVVVATAKVAVVLFGGIVLSVAIALPATLPVF